MGRVKEIRRAFRRPLEAMIFQVAVGLIPLLPRVAIIALAEFAGSLTFYLSKRERLIGFANLEVVFGQNKSREEKRAILKNSLISFSQTILDIFWFTRNTEHRLRKYHSFVPESSSFFDKCAHVVITAHAGNWELIGFASAVYGIDVAGIAAITKNRIIDQRLNALRQATGFTVIPREGAMRTLIARLRNNQKVGFVLDQNTIESKGGIWVEFLGLPKLVSAAPALLAYRTGTDIIFVFSHSAGKGKFDSRIGPIISPPAYDPKQDRDQVVADLTQQIMDVISEHILQNPDSWLWSYKYWRDLPPGAEPGRYPAYG